MVHRIYNGEGGNLPLHKKKFYAGIYNKRILDVGCGSGQAARYLSGKDNILVGVTISSEEACLANDFYQRIVIGDIEVTDVDSFGERYDVVLCGDVLEHLRDPWKVLRKLWELTEPGGVALVSVPNIANFKARMALLFGRFQYTETGIMDATHLRFFTRSTAADLVMQSGYRIEYTSYSNWNWHLLPSRLLRFPWLQTIEQNFKNELTKWWPEFFSTQIMIFARKDL